MTTEYPSTDYFQQNNTKGMGDLHHLCAADKSAGNVQCYDVSMEKDLLVMFPATSWKKVTQKIQVVVKVNGVQPSISKPCQMLVSPKTK